MRMSFWIGVALLVSVACAAIAGFGSAATARGASGGVPVDIELAFDTTGSMGSSLGRARQDARAIIDGVRAVVPNSRFAVVSFRDHDNPGGEYAIVQRMTADTAAVQAALGQLHAVSNPSPSNLAVESYNLAFHRSYADPALGWRTQSRKIVVVVGDAEPYGGGAANVAGCHDTHVDPDGFNVQQELARMRANRRTLVMIRAISSNTTASLECYSSLTGLTYSGGTARNSTDNDLVAPLVALVRAAVAPISIVPALPLALPNQTTVLTVRLANPNDAALQAQKLVVSLPRFFAYVGSTPRGAASGSTVTWALPSSLAPHTTANIVLRVKAGRATRAASFTATGAFQLAPDGGGFTSSTRVTLPVTRSISVRTTRGSSDGVTAAAKVTIRARSWNYAIGRQTNGVFSLKTTRGTLWLSPMRYAVSLARGHAVARFTVRLARARGSWSRTCTRGVSGHITVIDRSFGLTAGGGTVQSSVPACDLSRRWSIRAESIRPS